MPNYINVPVPEHLVPAVMALISEQMIQKETSSNPVPVPTPAPATIASSKWSESELQKLWKDSGPQMRKVLKKLAENGGKAVPGYDILKEIGREHKVHKLPGMMGALGRRLKHRHGGRWPFSRNENEELSCWEYVMPLANAEHILKFVSQSIPEPEALASSGGSEGPSGPQPERDDEA